MGPYRVAEPPPFVFAIERPFFPRIGDRVSIRPITHIEGRTCTACFGRTGKVVHIRKSVYEVEFDGPCPILRMNHGIRCGRRLCHASAGLFLIDELGEP